jgi:hypothetical protein
MVSQRQEALAMWWAIGIGVLVVIAFLAVKFRAASHQLQLIQAGRNHLWLSFQSLREPAQLLDRGVDGRVWSDPYLLGYAQGSLAIMTSAFGQRLSATQKGMVFVRVVQDLAGDRWQEVCERVDLLGSAQDPEFVRGMQNGSDVAILMANRAGPALLADPDVQRALRLAPEQARFSEAVFGPADTGQSAVAGTILMQDYMVRHKREAGY